MKTYFTAIALLTLVSHAFARIGETEQQIEARYGKSTLSFPSSNQPLTKAYESSGLNIVVMYIDGVSQREIFTKQDKSEFSKNEIAILLDANAAGSKWIEDPTARVVGMRGWKLEAGGRKAGYSESARGLLIQTEVAEKVSAQHEAEAEKEKLKGF
jgi:hypothetical protein